MTTRTDTETTDVLRELLQTCRDREQGYRTARDGIRNIELQQLFESYAQQSVRLAHELQEALRQHGGHPEAGGSVAGAAFRGWMQLKAALTRGDEGAVLAECERGEDVATERYQRALQQPVPDAVRTLISRQWNELEQAHNHIRMLRDEILERLDGTPPANYG